MTGILAGEGVGDFVKNGFADGLEGIGGDEVEGKLDAFFGVAAEAQGTFAAVPGERPIGQAVGGEQVESGLTGVGEIHP